jgi:hypothetical protein
MSVSWTGSVQLLLPGGREKSGKLALHAAFGAAVHPEAFLRIAAADALVTPAGVSGQPQTGERIPDRRGSRGQPGAVLPVLRHGATPSGFELPNAAPGALQPLRGKAARFLGAVAGLRKVVRTQTRNGESKRQTMMSGGYLVRRRCLLILEQEDFDSVKVKDLAGLMVIT